MNYQFLEKAKVALNHLYSSSAIHTDPFAAIAELVDNSYDALANNFYINFVQRLVPNDQYVKTLEFLDDGAGMSRTEALNVISFGHSEKSTSHIGRYGIGLKAGVFHLGRELLLLTKKDGVHTIMMISHKFHEEEKLKDSVFVPCPSFDEHFRPFFGYKDRPTEAQKRIDLKKHELEMELIQKFSPYGHLSVKDLFRMIPTDSGTMIIVERLRISLSGEFMLDVITSQTDIRSYDKDLPPHEQSLRSYLEILYLKPKMKIHLRGAPVIPTKIMQSWVAKYRAEVPLKTFKDVLKRSELERETYIKSLESDREVVNSDIHEILTVGVKAEDRNTKTKDLVKRKDYLNEMIAEAKRDKEIHSKNSKTSIVTFFIGVQTENRADNGIHVYANNRLVKWGHKATSFYKNNKESIGISAYVDLDASTWIPIASKQGLRAEDMTILSRKCNEKLNEQFDYFEKYWITKNLGVTGEDVVAKFWNQMGYQNAFSAHCSKVAATDSKIDSLMRKECPKWFVCSECGKWKCDVQGRVTRADKTVTCRGLNGRGCNEVPEAGDNENFKMDKASWAKIQLQMQQDKERAARRLANSTASTSTPSASMTYPNSILKKTPTSGPQADVLRVVKSEPAGTSDSFVEILDDFAVSPVRATRQAARRSNESAKHTATRSRAVVESESDHEEEFMDDVDVEVNPEDIVPDPEHEYLMDDADEVEEVEEESPRRRDPKPQASRPMTKVSRRRPISPSSEEESDQEAAATPTKKAREAKQDVTKASQRKHRFNRGEAYEKAINALLTEYHVPPLPKKGEFVLDLNALIGRLKASIDAEKDRNERQIQQMEVDAATVLDFLGSQPYMGIDVNKKLPIRERLHNVACQAREKKNKKKRQPKKK